MTGIRHRKKKFRMCSGKSNLIKLGGRLPLCWVEFRLEKGLESKQGPDCTWP